ncbi:chloride channel protein [uncultured Paraglaciecola sp.]|uniref:chloride channel protein n=1 Tax=uncultured Paraglaciecola sp. TaxID=1765024 RepID=UPI0025EF73DA|nr:chloride channel protein [uncultured Paraglaciecola sp.]
MNLNAFRQELATPRTSIQLCIIGIVGGICAASLIILFRLSVEWLQRLFLPELNDFASLEPYMRFLLPCVGALAIVLIAYLTGFKHYRMGIPFVIHRVKHYFGHIPFRTAINQFLGGTLALVSGFSVGREGPSVHLGAFGSSFFGQWLKFPHNSIRILSGCGIAAGISASFNTPFAAVIFVMEVVLREYKIHIFIPVMLAAACGTVLTRIVFGEAQELSFIQFHEFSQWIYLYLIIFGILLGCLATLFNKSLMLVISGFGRINMARRLLIAGLITGAVGYILPDALGAHFHSAHLLIAQNENIQLLIGVIAAKFLLTIFALGLGIPGGIIGPVFVIGMLSGVVLAYPLGFFIDDVSNLNGSFSLLGMAGLMTAVIHAPLAALSAVMELSYSPELILPTILVIVPAYVTSTQFLGNSSIFTQQLDYQKLPYTISSVMESLQKTGVLAVMDKNFKLLKEGNEQLISTLDNEQDSAIVQFSVGKEGATEYSLVNYDKGKDSESKRLTFTPMQGVDFQATLAEVYRILELNRDGAVYIFSTTSEQIVGIIKWKTLRHHLHKASY